jgi:hypothetical protein
MSILFFFFLFCYYAVVLCGLTLGIYERRRTVLLDLVPFFGVIRVLGYIPIILIAMWGEIKNKWGEML